MKRNTGSSAVFMSSWFDTMDLQVGQDYRDTPTWRTPCCWAVPKQRKSVNSSQPPGYFACLPLELFWLQFVITLEEITHGENLKPSTPDETEQTISLWGTKAQSLLIQSRGDFQVVTKRVHVRAHVWGAFSPILLWMLQTAILCHRER